MTPDEFMRDVWRGPDEEATACRECLDALGDGPEGDRLRDLLTKIVRHYRRTSGPPWPSWPCLTAPGDRMTPERIATEIGWPADTIERDLQRLIDVGLLRDDGEM